MYKQRIQFRSVLAIRAALLLLLFTWQQGSSVAQTCVESSESYIDPQYHHSIHFVQSGLPLETAPTVLFIHGTPKEWTVFKSYITNETLCRKAHLIAVDRPGYGGSEPGKALTSVEEQAACFKPLLESSQRPVILVGYSYGTAIAARLAMDYPELVAGLILLSPLVKARSEVTFINYVLEIPPIKSLLSPALKVCNQEKLNHRAELRKMEPLWRNISCPCIILHSKYDLIAPPPHAKFALRQMAGNTRVKRISFYCYRHDLQNAETEAVMKAIFELLEADDKTKASR